MISPQDSTVGASRHKRYPLLSRESRRLSPSKTRRAAVDIGSPIREYIVVRSDGVPTTPTSRSSDDTDPGDTGYDLQEERKMHETDDA